jgi:hypothetical protein
VSVYTEVLLALIEREWTIALAAIDKASESPRMAALAVQAVHHAVGEVAAEAEIWPSPASTSAGDRGRGLGSLALEASRLGRWDDARRLLVEARAAWEAL